MDRAVREKITPLSPFSIRSPGNFFAARDITLSEGLESACHRRRTAGARSKFGGSFSRCHGRDAQHLNELSKHTGAGKHRRQRRTAHAGFFAGFSGCLYTTLLPLPAADLWIFPPPCRRTRSRGGTHPGNISRPAPRRHSLPTTRALSHLSLCHRLQDTARPPPQSRLPRHVLWPKKLRTRSLQAGCHRVRSVGAPRGGKARAHRPRSPHAP